MKVLEFVGLSGERELADIAAYTGMPKSTLLRLIGTLIDAGFLERTAHGRYRVTLKLWQLGCGAVNYERVRDTVIPKLRELTMQTSETAHYAVYDAGQSVYVEKIDGSHPIRSYTKVGGSSPAYATATGKALLAWQDEQEIAWVGESAQQFTSKTHIGKQELLKHMADIRRTGFAVNRGEWREAVWGVAAPVFGRSGSVEAAVGVSGPDNRLADNIDEIVKAVCSVAHELSATNGFSKQAS